MTSPTNLPAAESRARLEALTEQRKAHLANAETLRARMERAAVVVTADAPIAAALADLDTKESAAMLAWLEVGGKQPAADTKLRAKLEHDLAQTRASASAARSAQATLAAEARREEQAATNLGAAINRSVADVLEAEIDALAQRFAAEKVRFAAELMRLEQAHKAFAGLAHTTAEGEHRAAILARVAPLGDKIKAALKAPEDENAERAALSAWTTFAARLAAGDANATLS
jgi:hypothetical protein